MKAFISRLTSGIGKPPTMPMLPALVMRARDDAGQVGRVLDVVVEDRKVRVRRRIRHEARAHQEGHVRIFGADLARLLLDAEDLAHDQLDARLAVLAHHARIVGVRHVLGVGVVDRRPRPSAASAAMWMRLTHCCSTGTV